MHLLKYSENNSKKRSGSGARLAPRPRSQRARDAARTRKKRLGDLFGNFTPPPPLATKLDPRPQDFTPPNSRDRETISPRQEFTPSHPQSWFFAVSPRRGSFFVFSRDRMECSSGFWAVPPHEKCCHEIRFDFGSDHSRERAEVI